MKISFSEEAKQDAVEISTYIAKNNADVAGDVFDNVWYTCELLASMPKMGTPIDTLLDTSQLGEDIQEIINARPLLKGLRRFPVKKYKKLIVFYKEEENQLFIIRVLHGQRDIPTLFSDMEV